MFAKIENKEFNKKYWLMLARSENVGSKTFSELIKVFKTPEKALEQIPILAENGGLKRKISIANEKSISEELQKTKDYNADIICAFEQDFPINLKMIPDCPPVLTIKGNKQYLISENSAAIVGSRNASISGVSIAKSIALELTKNKIATVSGLAKGIDASAHESSLSYGTIGVIAGGIDNIYPEENKKLYEKIFENGCIVTEVPFGTPPVSANFPMRNRIISGLSKAVVVVEAARKSGTLITARYANQQGKKVFAVAGSPLDVRHSGTNYLIHEGLAQIYMDSASIIRYLNSSSNYMLNDNSVAYEEPNYDEEVDEKDLIKQRSQLNDVINFESCSIEELHVYTKIPMSNLNYLILELELAGKIERLFGNQIRKIPS